MAGASSFQYQQQKEALERQQILQRVVEEVEEQLAEKELRFFQMEFEQESDSEGTCNTRIYLVPKIVKIRQLFTDL